MKLIIDIHKDQYEFIKQGMSIRKVIEYPALMEAICEYISNGISLEQIRNEQKTLITTNSTSDYSNGVMNCLNVIDKYR